MHFPLMIDLESRPCLVVGGGKVAARKVAALLDFGAAVTVVAPEMLPEIVATGCRLVQRPFAETDVSGMTLVVSATNDSATNACVAATCKARGIPVNVVDDPPNCTFVFPAIFRKGPILAAVSSGGKCPVAAKIIRDRVAASVSDDFVEAVERLGEAREDLKRRFPDPQDRRRHCEEVLAKWNG